MIFVDIPLNEWLKKIPQLKVIETTCVSCGNKIKAEYPVILKDYIGLSSKPCPCGDKKSGCENLITRTKKEHESWLNTLNYR
ncbi:MAG: hypothetical protein K2X69_12895 [Silvanigrellaceae bacterium]|nr:hypothetical protein [Silvanigrellaceae bacterium]